MAWGIVYLETADGKVPAEEFLDSCPTKIEARFSAVLEAVREADAEGLQKRGFDQPQIAIIDGLVKDSGEKFSDRDYGRVRRLRAEYCRCFPRRIAVD